MRFGLSRAGDVDPTDPNGLRCEYSDRNMWRPSARDTAVRRIRFSTLAGIVVGCASATCSQMVTVRHTHPGGCGWLRKPPLASGLVETGAVQPLAVDLSNKNRHRKIHFLFLSVDSIGPILASIRCIFAEKSSFSGPYMRTTFPAIMVGQYQVLACLIGTCGSQRSPLSTMSLFPPHLADHHREMTIFD